MPDKQGSVLLRIRMQGRVQIQGHGRVQSRFDRKTSQRLPQRQQVLARWQLLADHLAAWLQVLVRGHRLLWLSLRKTVPWPGKSTSPWTLSLRMRCHLNAAPPLPWRSVFELTYLHISIRINNFVHNNYIKQKYILKITLKTRAL